MPWNTPPPRPSCILVGACLSLLASFYPVAVDAAKTTGIDYSIRETPFSGADSGLQRLINDKGQVIAIVDGAVHIHLPSPDYNLPAGEHVIISSDVRHLVDFNNSGNILAVMTDTQRSGLVLTDGEPRVIQGTVTGLDDEGRALIGVSLENPTGMEAQATPAVLEPDDTRLDAVDILPYKGTPGRDSFYSFYDINSAGFAVGRYHEYQRGTDPERTQMVIWDTNKNASLQFLPTNGSTDQTAWMINNKNQVYGHRSSSAGGAEHFIYLPQPDYGLPAGFSDRTELRGLNPALGTFRGGSRLTDHGEIYMGISPPGLIWYRGRIIRPEDFLTGIDAQVDRILDVNNGGALLASGTINSESDRTFVIEPALTVTVEVSRTRIQKDDTFDLNVIISNESKNTFVLAGIQGASFQVFGNVELEQLDNPPANTALAPGTSWTQRFPWRAKNLGELYFSFRVIVADSEGNQFNTDLLESETVVVGTFGDLQIKKGSESPDSYAGDENYQDVPVGEQSHSIAIAPSQTASFDVLVENDDENPAAFTLHAEEIPGSDWTTAYTTGDIDITASVLSPEGFDTGELEPGANLEVRATYTAMTSTAGDERRVLFRLRDEDNTVVDTVESVAQVAPVPISITIHRLDSETVANAAEGLDDPDLPLVPVTDATKLAAAPAVRKGMVGDGVTPLLIRIVADIEALNAVEGEVSFDLDLDIVSGGHVGGDPLPDRLHILDEGTWKPGSSFTLSSEEPEAFAYIGALKADEVQVTDHLAQLVADLVILDGNEIEVGKASIFIRKPPIILIHGYNTNGNWGSEFIDILHRTRPRHNGSFVRVGRYGQGLTRDLGVEAYINTVYPLRNLVAIASEEAFDNNFEPIKELYAVTRHDVIAHSQGGVLTRMMCAENVVVPFLPRKFQSESDFYRGRFHRVVTVGSPQNGTRSLYYMRALLNSADFPSSFGSPPVDVAILMRVGEVAQYKFDPFSWQIRQINKPGGPWAPDSDAPFHIIRTTVNDGEPPGLLNGSPSDLFLALLNDGGKLVLPRGSDGVVDFDSMGCHGPEQTTAANVYTITGANIAHSGPLALFGGDAAQTASRMVAEHAIGALDQTLPPAIQDFSPFPVPPLLSPSEKQKIDLWAATKSLNYDALTEIANQPAPASTLMAFSTLAEGETLELRLQPAPDMTPEGPVRWIVESYEQDGISYDTLQVSIDSGDPYAATIDVPAEYEGEAVVYAGYATASGEIVLAPPVIAISRPPQGSTLVNVEVEPDGAELRVGQVEVVTVTAIYANGARQRVFAAPESMTAVPDKPELLDTTQVGLWKALAPGAVTVNGQYQGIAYSVDLQIPAETAIPVIAIPPGDQNTHNGDPLSLSVVASGPGPHTFQWFQDGAPIPGATESLYELPNTQSFHNGTYTVQVSNAFGSVTSEGAYLSVTQPDTTPGRLANLSTRAQVLTGDRVLIPGFVIRGTAQKRLLIRAVGPKLVDFGVQGVLADPELSVESLGTVVAQNNNWSSASNAADIASVSNLVGAFPLDPGSADSVLLLDLVSGPYTAVARGVSQTSGISIVEIYDADDNGGSSDLINISNRGFAGTGDRVMIPGFTISADGPRKLLVRVVGPTLGEFGVSDVLTDPKLSVFASGPAGNEKILTQDNWGDNPGHAVTQATAEMVGAFPLVEGSLDAAFVITLDPGSYTVVGESADGTSEGIVLVEIYQVD